MKKSKKLNIESFTAEDAAIYLKNILTNPPNLLWNIAELYEEAAADDSRQDLKDAAAKLRGLYDEKELQKLPGIRFFFEPETRIWHLSNIITNPACLVYNVARLYHDAAKKREDLKDTAEKLADLADVLQRKEARP